VLLAGKPRSTWLWKKIEVLLDRKELWFKENVKAFLKNRTFDLVLVAHACNPSYLEAEIRIVVQGQPGNQDPCLQNN
jgi:hypothetical protein